MGHEAAAAGSGAEALESLRRSGADLVITDYRMEGMDGLELLGEVKKLYPETDVIMVTGHGSIEVAVQAMQGGAADFVVKDNLDQVLPEKVRTVLENRRARRERDRLEEENEYLREEIGDRYGKIVGDSQRMRQVMAAVERVGGTDSSVLIYGESGTGKELVARALHRGSRRREGPFVRVNCGALPRELAESELFGHERGAFTGAVRTKKGKFELAEGGTIFLDEVADLSPELQVSLLRVLQAREYDRVGGERTLQADVRVVAATNRPLKEMVEEKTFREDLFYRLEVIPLHLPPLRECREDIPLLVDHYLEKKSREINRPVRRLSGEALEILCDYGWPGNVRELENVIERTIVLSDGEAIEPSDLPLETMGRTGEEVVETGGRRSLERADGAAGARADHAGHGGGAGREDPGGADPRLEDPDPRLQTQEARRQLRRAGMTRFLPLTLLTLMGTLLPAGGQLDELADLKSSRERIDRVSQSLQQIRSRFMARRDSLSSLIDSLRSRAPGLPDLRRLQLESRQLLHRLLHVESLDSAARQAKAIWASDDYRRGGGDPFKMVSRLALVGHLMGETPLFNCKSGKERTGQLDAEVKFLAAAADESGGTVPPPGESMEAWRPVRSDFVFNTGNLEMQRLNTGLPGYKLKGVPGLANVIRDGMKPLYRGGSAYVSA